MKEKYSTLLIVILILIQAFTNACKTKIYVSDLPKMKDEVRIRLIDSSYFTYDYYFYDGYNSNSLISNYCTGKVFNLDNEIKLLVTDSFNNFSVKPFFYKSYLDTMNQTKRFVVNTAIYYDQFYYESVLILDDVRYTFKGSKIDTVINNINPERIKVEIRLTDTRFNMMPKSSFKMIITEEIIVKEKISNYFNIKIPITENTFNYKYIQSFRIKDNGDHYLILEENRVAKKIK